MCENLKYWMKLYMARVIKGGLVVVASFLLFECSDDSSKMDNSVIGNVIISENTLAFYDFKLSGRYTISLSQDPAPDKKVQITLTSDNVTVSPTVVNFTKMTGKAPQPITITWAVGNENEIPVDITAGMINHTIASIEDGDPNITTFQDGSTVGVTVKSTLEDDLDHDGLLEIKSAEMLDNMRHNLMGTSYKTSGSDGVLVGCPAVGGCDGYELIVDIDLDGMWTPIGPNSVGFSGNFEGNGHTIKNLRVSTNFDGGLFSKTNGTTSIRNVGVFGSVSSSHNDFSSGGLVGHSEGFLTIINSYFISSGDGVSSYRDSGGLVGFAGGSGGVSSSLTIMNSYFSGSGGISSSSTSVVSYAGGLVGQSSNNNSLTIMNSYFSGLGEISSSSSSASRLGGLVGLATGTSLTITNSYFGGSGEISVSGTTTQLGGLVGNSVTVSSFTGSYWNIDAPQSVNSSPQSPKRAQGNVAMPPEGVTDLTLTQLKATSGMYPDGLGSAWNLTAGKLPAVKLCVPTITNDIADWTTCASYGDLIPGQR